MNHTQLASAARRDAEPYAPTLSRPVLKRLERAYIAEWLFQQDDAVIAAAAVTACKALATLMIPAHT